MLAQACLYKVPYPFDAKPRYVCSNVVHWV